MVKLRAAVESDLDILTCWFNSAGEARSWGGPRIRYPFEKQQLKEDIRWEDAQSFTLEDEQQLLGFAQVFERFGCRHIGQVAVNPDRRGEGLGKRLIQSIIELNAAGGKNYSLFVYTTNIAAKKLYDSLGFEIRPLPSGEQAVENCVFMIKQNSAGTA